MRAKGAGGTRLSGAAGWILWQRHRRADAAFDEAKHWLDLAGFADGRLGKKDRKRLAALIGHDADAASDIAAARALGGVAIWPANQQVIGRAAALVGEEGALCPFGEGTQAIVLPARQGALRQGMLHLWHGAAGWSSLAAAVVVAGWLGFGLGSGTLRPYPAGFFEDAAAAGLFDPAPSLVRDFTEGWQT